MKLMKFATIMGRFLSKIPYANHSSAPLDNRMAYPRLISLVNFVLKALAIWGKSELTVKAAATKPTTVM